MLYYTKCGLEVATTPVEDALVARMRANGYSGNPADMLMCDREQARRIAAGECHYDYDAQKWVGEMD